MLVCCPYCFVSMDYAARQRHMIETHMFDRDRDYHVEKIIDYRRENGLALYLVKWRYFPRTFNTWEPEEHLIDVQWMIDEFWDRDDDKIKRTVETIKCVPVEECDENVDVLCKIEFNNP